MFSLPKGDSQETAKQIASLEICFEVDAKRKSLFLLIIQPYTGTF